jgi:sortase A
LKIRAEFNSSGQSKRTMQENLKRHLRWLEAGLYLGGVALLAVFFFLRSEGERQREAGIEAFQLAADRMVREAQAGEMQVALAGPGSGEILEATVAAPDVALWAEKRVREYEESMRVEADPPLAIMTIQKLGIQVPVYDGADDFNLNRGVGRIKGTAMVSGVGNMGVAGHRDSFFRGLKDIAIGDGIDLLTMNGKELYTVSSIEIVDPGDVWVLAPSEEKMITLVTCYPFYYVGHAPKRYIVKATAEHSFAHN